MVGGDTLGVLITTPLVLSWLAEPRSIWRRRRMSVAVPLAGALALAVLVFVYTRAQERERLRLLAERQATTLAQSLRNRLDDYLNVLHAVESLHATSGGLSRQAFHTFVQRSFTRHPGLQALSWDVRVPDEQRESYEEAVRREGYPSFQITELNAQGQLVRVARRPEYIVVSYIQPEAENERALGFDVASAPDCLEALRRARDTGEPAATGQLTLVQETVRHVGLLVFLPIYGQPLPHATVEERRQSLQGYVTGVFRISDMVEASLPVLEHEGLGLQIEDEAAPAGQRLLYDSRRRGARDIGPKHHQDSEAELAGMHWDTTIELAGRRWVLRFAPTLEYLAARQSLQPWAVLGGGLLFAGLLGTFLLIVTGRASIVEQLVAERTAQLEAAVTELAAFSYSIAHDLRAPLRAMNSFAGILLEDYAPQLDAEAQHYLQRVSSNALRMGQLIDDLLAFAQLSHTPLKKQPVAPADLVREALEELRPEYEHRRVEFSIGELPPCQADPALLKQVWTTLLDNALKFTRERAVARIEAGWHDRQGEYVYSVRDNGIGFQMQYADKVFGVFQRLHRREDYEGTGVGLALAQRIVHRHGGRIWAEAKVDQGATFYFTLGT